MLAIPTAGLPAAAAAYRWATSVLDVRGGGQPATNPAQALDLSNPPS